MPKRYDPHITQTPMGLMAQMRPSKGGDWVSIDDYKNIYFEWTEFAYLTHRVKCLIGAEHEDLTNNELIEKLAERLNG